MIFNYSRSGSSTKFEYTGNYTTAEYTQNGVAYTLYTLTSTGTATIKAKSADIWLCGGGSNGLKGSAGGAGAYCASVAAQELEGDYLVTIGAGNGGATSFATLATANGVANNMSGGTGGGGTSYSSGGNYTTGGSGDGVSKYPFGDSTFFKCHCAGGGGGDTYWYESGADDMASYVKGGAGGTNGGAGSNGNSGTNGAGGNYGGGAGAGASIRPNKGYTGGAATFYGSAGGGGGWAAARSFSEYVDISTGAGGSGYQGVVYVRIPA